MDAGRFAGVEGSQAHASHQRIAEYVRPLCEHYPALGFTPREEWVVEQTVEGLRRLLSDIRCTAEERKAIEEFLTLAAERLPGEP